MHGFIYPLGIGSDPPGVLWASGAVRPDVELEVGNHETGLSGYAGTKVKKVGLASDIHAVHEIKIGEWEDHPCYLRAYKSDINHKTAQTYEDWNRCEEGGYNFFSQKTLGWEETTYNKIRGLAVCTNKKKNHRMKGLKVYGTAVYHDGSLVHQSNPQIVERPNCKIWHRAVFCPAQYIATKVVIHHTGDETNGLGLICRKVKK